MDHLSNMSAGWLSPGSLVGAALLAVLFFVLASMVVVLIRGGARRVERHLSDVTALQFVSALAQLLTYLVGFVLYAHLVPPLRALGTALLAGVSVVSVVVGLAAQSTLGNLIAGFSLVLYRQIPTSLRSRFIGGTYHKVVHGVDPWNQSMFRGTPRGVQIQQDAQRRTPRHWIALDDDLEDWPEAYRHHLIACDGMKGLSDPSVQCELEEQLQRCHSTPFTPG